MPAGKACSQSSHATLGSFMVADVDRQKEYHRDGIGTKIVLTVPNLDALLEWREWAKSAKLPFCLIEDTGRNSCFGGLPTVSALGIGPLFPPECRDLRRLKLMK